MNFFIYVYNQQKYGAVLPDYMESISCIYLGVRKFLIGFDICSCLLAFFFQYNWHCCF